MKKYIYDTFEKESENEKLEKLMKRFYNKNFAYDGCHKIYILDDYNQEIEAEEKRFDIYPIAHLQKIFNRSCSLRFIESWDLKHTYIKQGEYDDLLDQQVITI